MSSTTRESNDFQKYETYRMLASLSFAVTLIVIGLPLWWHTTEVYRVPLPYAGIAALKDLEFRVSLNIFIACRDDFRAELLVEELENQFSKSEIFDINFARVVISSDALEKFKSPAALETHILKNTKVDVGDFIFIEWKPLKEEVLVTSDRSAYFSDSTSAQKLGRVISEWILAEDSISATLKSMRSHSYVREESTISQGDLAETNKKAKEIFSVHHRDANGRRRMPPSPAYDILLTVVNPNPEELTVDLDIESAGGDYIEPFLDELNSLANFTIKSQWLYFVELDYKPRQVPDQSILGRHYVLPEEILPHLITPLEKKLSSQVSQNPCLNLVLYLPGCKTSPLHIYTRKGIKAGSSVDAFLSPRWGGVVISNPPEQQCKKALENDIVHATVKPNTAVIMGTFLYQLRLLLGITENKPIHGADIVELESLSPRSWELDALKRVRTLEQLTSTSLTLQSIAQLLDEISNIVINDDIGESISTALEECVKAREYLQNGFLDLALQHSKRAFLLSELAFTDQSLLALLYFPDDQKYAVYIPLFLPIMIPVVLSFGNLRYWIMTKFVNKAKTD